MSTRLSRFRALMARLEPASDPAEAVSEGLYVERGRYSPAHRLAERMALKPDAALLLVGGIGSGKTTELRVVEQRLSAFEDMVAIYVDVSRYHDLADLKAGALLAAAGLGLERWTQLLGAQESFRKWAYEYRGPPLTLGDILGQPKGVQVRSGLLTDPDRLSIHTRELITELQDAVNVATGGDRKVLFIFDSLDRLTDPTEFTKVIDQDLRALKSAGHGVILTGPSALLYGKNRELLSHFDHFETQPYVDVKEDMEATAFLHRILRRRADESLLGDDEIDALVDWSGGVVRDLIALTQSSVQEAYFAGNERVTTVDVLRAAGDFGRTHMLGLGRDDVALLQNVRSTGALNSYTDAALALLTSRRILEYRSDRPRHVVHPTLVPFLERLAKAS
ncbi:MAG: hypothetical protein H6739_12195 [Alphaproteobacteria bacterium]|nr:hypothetical protein [Alphaproteobacteria bacterium]